MDTLSHPHIYTPNNLPRTGIALPTPLHVFKHLQSEYSPNDVLAMLWGIILTKTRENGLTHASEKVIRLSVLADYHTHTKHSHGRGTVEDNVRAAVARGLKAIAITDHGPANLFGVGVRSLDVFKTIRQEIETCQSKYPNIQILMGIEANIISLDGALDVPQDRLYEFDIVLAGFHLLVCPDHPISGMLFAGNLLGRYLPKIGHVLRQANTQAIIAALDQNPIDILTHPGLHVNIDTKAIAKACARNATYMEINTSHDHIEPAYVKIAFEAGARFVIGSDAHVSSRVGDAERGIQLAKAAGLPLAAIHNIRIGQETWI